MSHLEEIWNCELESFQTVERLAQCLAQRGQTWQRLKLLREQVRLVFPITLPLFMLKVPTQRGHAHRARAKDGEFCCFTNDFTLFAFDTNRSNPWRRQQRRTCMT